MRGLCVNPLRHQLAGTSPLGGGILWRAASRALRSRDPRLELAALFRARYRVAEVVLCGSGTESLTLALQASARLAPADAELVLPAYACFDVAAAAVRAGRRVHFYDIDPASLGPQVDSLSAALDAGGTIVVIASLFGVPVDWTRIDPVLGRYTAVVIEDAAQGHGATWRGGPLGSRGRLGVLSFARGKGWTGGSGGALLIRDVADFARLDDVLAVRPAVGCGVRVGFQTVAHWMLGRPGIYRLPHALPGLGLGETRYRSAQEPSALRRLSASILLESQARADATIVTRRVIAAEYRRMLPGHANVTVIAPAGDDGDGCLRYPILLARGMSTFADPALATRLGAAPGYPIPLPRLPELRSLIADGPSGLAGAWCGAERLARELVTLPTHFLTRPAERRALAELLSDPLSAPHQRP